MMQLYRRSQRFVRLVIASAHCILLTSQFLVLADVLRLLNDTRPAIASNSFPFGLMSDREETNFTWTSNDHHQQQQQQPGERSGTLASKRQPRNFTVRSDLEKVRLLEDRTRKLPDAIIVGVKKGGTRALLEFLKVHPDVRAPGPEIHFFDRQYHKGLDWYRSRMPARLEGQLTVEKTPSYFVTKSVPQRVYAMSPDVKLVLVVRDPVTRALSDYTQARLKRPNLPSFETMAFVNASAPSDRHQHRQPSEDARVNVSWGAIRIGLYSRYLDRWLQQFSLDRFHFVSGERLVADPAGELRRLQDFLGIKRLVTDKHFYYNAIKGFPCLKKAERGGGPRCLGQSKGRAHPVVDPDVLRRLRDFYRPHNRRFYDMTGVDFGWN